MKVAYSFSVLRYVHDPVTQEFINIGVAVFSPEEQFLRAICTTSYGRITHMFQRIDGQRFRQLSRYIQDQICAAESDYKGALPFEAAPALEQLLAKVLPPDDSAIQFSKAGVGLSGDLDRTLRELYHRHVEQYAASGESPRRTDEDVWRVFREPLDRALVTPRLKPKRIVAPNFDYEFERAWKNRRWHVYEPLSFDLVEASSMLMKANRWLGQATSLMESSDPFKIHFMLGEPQDERLKGAFTKAENILNMIPAPKEFIRESEAEAFAEELAREVQAHPDEEPAE
ncbi:MAG TPA: DUF3037 domain-containing protein [Candidatus Acidoferrales bacterium]|nr:DUF3037 domain-containing protein [Candidatus Acidoferrales bacterium]